MNLPCLDVEKCNFVISVPFQRLYRTEDVSGLHLWSSGDDGLYGQRIASELYAINTVFVQVWWNVEGSENVASATCSCTTAFLHANVQMQPSRKRNL